MSSAFLCRPGSTLGARVVELLDGECTLLAPAARVRIDDRSVLWNGTRLDGLALLLVEEPLVPWPQPTAEPRAGEPLAELQRRGYAARERRALHVSALRLLARETRVVNDPARAAQLACSAALALERLELGGVPVRRWRIASGAGAQDGWCAVPLAAEHEPADDERGDDEPSPRLEVELRGRAARAHLCIDGEWIAASEPAPSLAPPLERLATDAPAAECDLACAALSALRIDFGCVYVSDGAVARVSVAPDLEGWNRASDGCVARALAELLTSPRTAPVSP